MISVAAPVSRGRLTDAAGPPSSPARSAAQPDAISRRAASSGASWSRCHFDVRSSGPARLPSASSAAASAAAHAGGSGRPLARCPLSRVLFQRPPARTTRAAFTACGSPATAAWLRGLLLHVDAVVAGRTDYEGLAPHPGHLLRPRGLWLSCHGEVSELADLMPLHPAPLAA